MTQNGFVTIHIGEGSYEVPADGTLLQAFQYLRTRQVMAAGFCWNGECVTCEVETETEDGPQPALACQLRVRDGMKVSDVSLTLRGCLKGLCAPVASHS